MGLDAIPELARNVAAVVRSMMTEVRPDLVRAALSGEREESRNDRHADNFLSVHDLRLHRRYREALTELLGSFVYASEEAEPQTIGTDPEPDLCVLVDPLDTSELAVRGLHGYTQIMIYSRKLARPIVAIVGDFYHYFQLYLAARGDDGTDRAFLITADSEEHRLFADRPRALSESLITNYLMRPNERFMPLARQERLMRALAQPAPDGKSRGRIGVDFGSISLCHVAAGFTDATIEIAKGFAIWDLAPGHFVLHAAGGTILDLQGMPISLGFDFGSLDAIADAMNRRQKFVAAGSASLAHEIVDSLDPSSAISSGHRGHTDRPTPPDRQDLL